MKTKEDVTAAGIKAQGGIDGGLVMADLNIDEHIAVVIRGVQLGMVSDLEAKKLIWQAKQLKGLVAQAGVLAAEMHIQETKICKANNCDTGSLTSVAGVDLSGDRSGGR